MLKKITRWFSLVLILISGFLGFWVYAENSQPVELILFGFGLGAQPLGLVVIAMFSAGIALGLFCNVLVTAWMAFKLKRMQKRLHELEKNPKVERRV